MLNIKTVEIRGSSTYKLTSIGNNTYQIESNEPFVSNVKNTIFLNNQKMLCIENVTNSIVSIQMIYFAVICFATLYIISNNILFTLLITKLSIILFDWCLKFKTKCIDPPKIIKFNNFNGLCIVMRNKTTLVNETDIKIIEMYDSSNYILNYLKQLNNLKTKIIQYDDSSSLLHIDSNSYNALIDSIAFELYNKSKCDIICKKSIVCKYFMLFADNLSQFTISHSVNNIKLLTNSIEFITSQIFLKDKAIFNGNNEIIFNDCKMLLESQSKITGLLKFLQPTIIRTSQFHNFMPKHCKRTNIMINLID